MRTSSPPRRSAFTLIELLVVIGIISLLMASKAPLKFATSSVAEMPF